MFSFEGLLLASLLINLPFMVQPIQRAFAAIPHSLREAAWVCGLGRWRTFVKIELPLAWPGLLAGVALTAAHTLGEFGVVLMVGGSIPGETRTLSIAIYDRVQAFDMAAAQVMSLVLVACSLVGRGPGVRRRPAPALAGTLRWNFPRTGPADGARRRQSRRRWQWNCTTSRRCGWTPVSTAPPGNWWRWWAPRAAARPACCGPSPGC